ncbi:MAG TPA: hypothetical protein DGD08_14025 [Gemmatimonas aurantiaca]|uniref:DUF4197 domain-containing protein n=2 Tax=Gemmatimonas aurantiaca TaxID=173480 RepID=C1AA76_GEMAT|nr:hypothetical protein [Gemmatimonas aurantiaca]BAH39674.1 hypothetical protein GAU_2632 [Gemmatimonas aurantiaca T-27]HCT58317.1 hypothetical protein [Gemmatimonas aurantiaca]
MGLSGAAWLMLAQLTSASPAVGAMLEPSAMFTPEWTASDLQHVTQSQQQVQQQVQFDAARFDSVTANTLRGLFEDAVEMGLPTKPLINRALEGSARRMTGERIVRVVRELAAALNEAKGVLGPGSTTDELVAGAEALRAGYDARTVAAVRAARTPGTAVTALMVLTDLARNGVPTGTAREAVTSIAKLPRSDEALLGLQLAVAKNAQRGPGMALDALNRYVRGTIPGSSGLSAPATTDRKPVRPPDS